MDEEIDKVTRQIRSKIGRPVTCGYPPIEGNAEGTLRDRFVLPVLPRGNVPYWDVVDLIEFTGESIRDRGFHPVEGEMFIARESNPIRRRSEERNSSR